MRGGVEPGNGYPGLRSRPRLVVLGIAVWLLANLYSFRGELAALLLFSTLLLLLNIAFSPDAFSGRIAAPYGIALCLPGLQLMRGDAWVRHTSGTLAGTSPPASVGRRATSSLAAAAARSIDGDPR